MCQTSLTKSLLDTNFYLLPVLDFRSRLSYPRHKHEVDDTIFNIQKVVHVFEVDMAKIDGK